MSFFYWGPIANNLETMLGEGYQLVGVEASKPDVVRKVKQLFLTTIPKNKSI